MRNRVNLSARLYPLLLGSLLFFLFLQLLPDQWQLIKRLTCPWQVNQGEAVNVEYARLVLQKQTLYPNPTQGPYLFTAYPPTFFVLESMLLGCSANPWLAGRLLAWAGYLGCTFLLFGWGWKRWRKKETMVLTLLFLSSPTWGAWGSMVRVDTLMMAFHFAAFLALTLVSERADSRKVPVSSLLIAGLLEGAAILLKQSAVSLVLVYGVFCLPKRKWKHFLLFAVVALAPFLALAAFLQISTSGLYGLYTWEWVSFGYRWNAFLGFLSGSFIPEAGWLLGGVILTWGFGKTRLLSRLQVLAALFWVLGLGRVSSAENYYLEFFLYGLYFLGEGWLSTPKVHSKEAGEPVFLGGVALVGFLCLCLRPWPGLPSREIQEMKAQILPLYERQGECLSLDLDLPLTAGKKIWIQPVEYTALVSKGVWSPEPLVRDIRAGKFSLIELYDIPQQYLLPPAVVDEIERAYRLWGKAFGRKWYIRR